MTAREWVPGDVALVEAGCWANRKVALRLAEGWAHTNGVNVDGDGVVDAVRSLVVVDPEDAEQAARIAQAILDAMPLVAADIPMKEGRAAYWHEALPLAVEAALRSLIEPPRPPEPTTWGVVEASCCHSDERRKWVHHEDGNWWPAENYGAAETRIARGLDPRLPDCWDDLHEPVVIREGVTA